MVQNSTQLLENLSLNTSDEVILSIKYMVDLGFNLNDVAILSGVSRISIYGWINGEESRKSNADHLLQRIKEQEDTIKHFK